MISVIYCFFRLIYFLFFLFFFGEDGLLLRFMYGPAIRSYGGLPALRADTWVCPYAYAAPPYHYYRVYFGGSLPLPPILNHGFFLISKLVY